MQKHNSNFKSLDHSALPEHIAIIMDGNRRWAKKKGLPSIMGHKKGVESVKTIVRVADKLGIKVLTLYAFSTENWNRSKIEVRALMFLLKSVLNKYTDELYEKGVWVPAREAYSHSASVGNRYIFPSLRLNHRINAWASFHETQVTGSLLLKDSLISPYPGLRQLLPLFFFQPAPLALIQQPPPVSDSVRYPVAFTK